MSDIEEYLAHTQQGLREPASEAAGILKALATRWDKWFPESDLIDAVFMPMWREPGTSGMVQIRELEKVEQADPLVPGGPISTDTLIAARLTGVLLVACAYCVQILREKDQSIAWAYVADANRWLGALVGQTTDMGQGVLSAASEMGKRGADAAHAENRAMKADVWDWCGENLHKYPSMDAAAGAVAGKLVKVTYRTARSWIGDWKKLQSGGTP